MESVTSAVRAIRAAADLLGETSQWLGMADPGPAAFGASGPGRLGELGQRAYGQFAQAVENRAREARSHAARAGDFADLVGQAVGGLDDAHARVGQANKELDGAGGEPGDGLGIGTGQW